MILFFFISDVKQSWSCVVFAVDFNFLTWQKEIILFQKNDSCFSIYYPFWKYSLQIVFDFR